MTRISDGAPPSAWKLVSVLLSAVIALGAWSYREHVAHEDSRIIAMGHTLEETSRIVAALAANDITRRDRLQQIDEKLDKLLFAIRSER